MSDDSFKNFNINSPMTKALNDIYKAQLNAMNRVQPTLDSIEKLNKTTQIYSQIFKANIPQITAPTVSLGIDLENLNKAITKINEPLIKSMKSLEFITAKQYKQALFSKEIFKDVYNLSGISPEVIEHSITKLRFNSQFSIDSMHASMKPKKIEDTCNNEISNKANDDVNEKSAPHNEFLNHLANIASSAPISNIICNPSV